MIEIFTEAESFKSSRINEQSAKNGSAPSNVVEFPHQESVAGQDIPLDECRRLTIFALKEKGFADKDRPDFIKILLAYKDRDPTPEGMQWFLKASKAKNFPNESKRIRDNTRDWNTHKRSILDGTVITFATILKLKQDNPKQWVIFEKAESKNAFNRYVKRLESAANSDQLMELADEIKADRFLLDSDRSHFNPKYRLKHKELTNTGLTLTDARAQLYPEKQTETPTAKFDITRELIKVLNAEGELYVDQNGEPYVDIDEMYALHVYSTAFCDWLRAKAFCYVSIKPLDNNTVSTISAHVAGLCRNTGRVYLTFKRCGVDETGEKHYIDLADKDNTVLELSANGYRVVDDQSSLSVRFIRGASATPLPIPTEIDPVDLPRNVDEIWKTLNVDNRYRHIVLACIVNAMLCRKQNPIMLFVGPPNSGKSVVLKQVRDLIDPQAIELGSKPSDQGDFVSRLSSGYMTAFDNMKGVSSVVEDITCNAADGGVYSKRRLRTTNDNASIDVSGPTGFTSVQARIFEQEDLQSRTVTIRVSPTEERKDRQEIDQRFSSQHQAIFSSLVALAVEVLKQMPEITDSTGHRYDQFVKTGNAILRVLALDESMADLFERERLNTLYEEVERHNSALRALVKTMVIEKKWNQACAPLLDLLNLRTQASNRGPDWPSTPQELADVIWEHRESLKLRGLDITKGNKSKRGRRYIIALNENAVLDDGDEFLDL